MAAVKVARSPSDERPNDKHLREELLRMTPTVLSSISRIMEDRVRERTAQESADRYARLSLDRIATALERIAAAGEANTPANQMAYMRKNLPGILPDLIRLLKRAADTALVADFAGLPGAGKAARAPRQRRTLPRNKVGEGL